MSVSNTIHEKLNEVPSESLDFRNQQCYRWLWYWLLREKPLDTLQQALDDVQDAVEHNNVPNQELAELAWKAEAIEFIIANRDK